MKTCQKMLLAAILSLGSSMLTLEATAADLEWSGVYRFEANHIDNVNLNGNKLHQDYGLHHLSLRPKIVAADGLTIYGQFEVFNFSGANGIYANSQLGQVLGDGLGSATAADGNMDTQNNLANRMSAQDILASQLYLSWAHEYGALIAGRAPLEFGLGMTYSAGRGAFDHWFDTRDLVGYKFILGNMWFLPMYGKVNEGELNKSEDVTDLMVQFQYDNPETDLEMGVFYRERKANDQGQAATTIPIGGTGSTLGETDAKTISVFVLKDTETFRVGVEGSFVDGLVGVRTSGGENVSLNGFGVAAEYEYRPQASKWRYGVKGGVATGDDPDSDGTFEGFAFNRNYDVALLLFNRPLGTRDVLRTSAFGGSPVDGSGNLTSRPDVESLSNAMYLAPYVTYQWSENWLLRGVFVTGWLNVDPIAGTLEVDSALGYELDLSLAYKPRPGLELINEVGMLSPGGAFKHANGESASFAFGLTSKLAISF